MVIGILDDVARQPDLLNTVLVPQGTAREHFGLTAPRTAHVHTELRAAQTVAEQATLALEPNDPDAVEVTTPPEPGDARSAVEADVNALFLLLGGVSLLIGALGIANVTLVSVLDAWVPLAAPAVGALVGLVAGAYPALRAARLEPIDALRA